MARGREGGREGEKEGEGWERWAADGGGEGGRVEEYDRVDWTRPSVLIVGNEGAGLSVEVRDGLREGGMEGGREGQVRAACIPLVGRIESLNAAAAGAIIMGEVARQRRRKAGGREGDVK